MVCRLIHAVAIVDYVYHTHMATELAPRHKTLKKEIVQPSRCRAELTLVSIPPSSEEVGFFETIL